MSLREQWYAARQQREQEVRLRQQHVLETRQQFQAEMAALHQYQRAWLEEFCQNLAAETAEFLHNTTADRAAMSAVMRESLNNFHTTLQAEVAAFLEETRSQQQQTWTEQAQERAAFIAALQDYVWGTAPSFSNLQANALTPGVNSSNLDWR
ncbi:gas vesicle protein GvpC [Nostoc sp. ChiSLP03a]|uniref:gas vesicle protein GvpC n=1 Tax=Nostoc sp. ChiSLP03a TaxID=3075380 RepID=UPI002AD523C7|nr:gas vesicle protein GvpC [Nostoc sp. ChiSLP03a]MDZ8213834.1 gas vesicle protein GvpC [Nostoc sp. ChiSLP03a]